MLLKINMFPTQNRQASVTDSGGQLLSLQEKGIAPMVFVALQCHPGGWPKGATAATNLAAI